MANFDQRVAQLRERVSEAAAAEARPDLGGFVSTVARLACSALDDPDHPLTVATRELADFAKQCGAPDAILFVPRPASSNPGVSRHWRTQLLLSLAARKREHRDRIATHLSLSPNEVKTLLDRIDEEEPGGLGTAPRSQEFAHRLRDALSLLQSEAACRPIRMEGRRVIWDGGDVELPPREAEFLAILLQDYGRPVGHDELERAGFKKEAARKCKHDVAPKLFGSGASIASVREVGYVLRDAGSGGGGGGEDRREFS